MARRKTNKRYPVQRHLGLTALGPIAADILADVPRYLSQTNHRLYRQSRYYECSVTLDTDLLEGTTVDVYALADTWMVQKSLQMAKAAWDESNAEEKEMLNGKVARWNDFRVNPGVVTPGGASTANVTNFLKRTLQSSAFTGGEFNNSQVVDQAGVTRTFTWGNPAANTYSIIEEYDASGNTSADPGTPASGAYTGLLPNLETGAAAALQDLGNNPPYDRTDIGQGIWVKIATLHLGAGRQRTSSGFFTAPCGIVVLRGAGAIMSDNQVEISVDCKRGDYKGVHAPSMLE